MSADVSSFGEGRTITNDGKIEIINPRVYQGLSLVGMRHTVPASSHGL